MNVLVIMVVVLTHVLIKMVPLNVAVLLGMHLVQILWVVQVRLFTMPIFIMLCEC